MDKALKHNKIAGSVYGLAFGDAYGWVNEFRSFPAISRQPSYFPTPAIITDDTQMSLYNVKALQSIFTADEHGISLLEKYVSSPEENESSIRQAFGEQFLIWLHDDRNTRAPGINCLETLTALDRTRNKSSWLEGTSDYSKGCGANMRNPWFGLLPVPEKIIIDLSIIQSSVTHNNPVALASSALTALCVKAVCHDEITGNLYSWLLDKTRSLILHGHHNTRYEKGLTESLHYFESMKDEYDDFLTSGDDEDICSFFGEGKIAEEALLLAVAAYDMYQEDVIPGLHRLANSGGDSDSIAAIGGAIFGSAYSKEVFPYSWDQALEPDYFQELQEAVHIMENLPGFIEQDS